MRLFRDIPEKGTFHNPVLTIGSFDGVHNGHRRIFSALLNAARNMGGEPVVLTFSSHPRKILNPETPPKILTTAPEKVRAIEKCGIDNVIMLDFTHELAEMSAGSFLNDLVFHRLGVIDIVIGYDHAFGRNREGNFKFLKELSAIRGFGVTRAEPKNFESRPISSTWIRTELEDGNIALAASLLGREYTISGTVARGDGRGRKLDFPTANVAPDDSDKVIPKDGVYAVRMSIEGDVYNGMLNIGTNPTFAKTERTIEVNIFGFNRDIYGAYVEIMFVSRMRDEIRFASADELVKQLRADREKAMEILK